VSGWLLFVGKCLGVFANQGLRGKLLLCGGIFPDALLDASSGPNAVRFERFTRCSQVPEIMASANQSGPVVAGGRFCGE
jgi:hypothetical protein